MKTFRLGVILLFLAGFARGENAPSFEIKSYSPEDGIVEIKTSSGITNRPFASFSAEEQRRINGWLADKEFEASGLQVEIEKSEDVEEIDKLDFSEPNGAFHRGEAKNVTYSIIIENRSSVPFNNIQLESRLFMERSLGKDTIKLCFTETVRTSLASGEKQRVSLKPISILDEIIQVSDRVRSSGTVLSGKPSVHNKDRLLGMHLCISKDNQNGTAIENEFEDGTIPDKERWGNYRIIVVPGQAK